MFEDYTPVGRGKPLHLNLDAVARGALLPAHDLHGLVALGYADATVTPPVLTAEGKAMLDLLGPLPG